MAKTPVYEADTVAELISRFKSGEIPGSYIVQGLGGVGKGGKITVRSETSLKKPQRDQWEQEQRRQTQNKKERTALAKSAGEEAQTKFTLQAAAREKEQKQRGVEQSVRDELWKKAFEARAGLGEFALDKIEGPDDPGELSAIKKLGQTVQKEQEKLARLEGIKATDSKSPSQEEAGQVMSAADQLARQQQASANAQYSPESQKALQNALDRGEGGGWLDTLGAIGTGALDVASRGIDIISRPGYAVSGGIEAYSNPDQSMSDVFGAIGRGLTGEDKKSWGDVIEANVGGRTPDPDNPGKYLEFDQATQKWVPAKELNPVLKATAGLAGDVLTDPTTYVGLGTIAKAGKGFMAGTAARAAVDIDTSAAKAGLKAAASSKAKQVARGLATRTKSEYIQKGGVIGPNPTEELKLFDDVMQQGGDLAGAQAAVYQSRLARAGVEAQQSAAERLLKENERVVNLNLMGRPVGGVTQKVVGGASSVVRKGVAATGRTRIGTKIGNVEKSTAHLVNKMFNTRYYFPGKTHELHKLAHEKGIIDYKNTVKEVQNTFRGVSKADRVRIANSVEEGIDLTGEIGKNGKDLGQLQQYFKGMRDKMFQEDMDILGKYLPADWNDRFVFHFYKAGEPFKSLDDIRAWKAARKKAIQANDTQAIERLSLLEAEKSGLKPIREADRILIAHYGDHTRRLVRDDFIRRIVENYGLVTDNAFLAHSQGLKEFKLTGSGFKQMKLAPNHKLYLTPDIKKVLQGTEKMMGVGDDSIRGALRGYDTVIRHWKFLNTAANPAHHIRNSMSDFFMNYMDGVQNPYRYIQSLNLLQSGKRAGMKFKVGGKIINGDEMMKLYQRSGSAQGFIASELGEAGSKAMRGIYNFAEHREEWTRLAHFIDIMQKETKHLNAGNSVGVWKKVREAGKRVNKWNIDYSDLTQFERNTMKRLVPFYTFYRKALPLMIEAMVTKPGRLLAAPKGTRAIENLLGIDPADQDPTHYPEWLTHLGFARLSNGDEPIAWSPGIPTQLPGDFLQGGDVKGILQNLAGMTTPPIRMGIEKATGRSLTTGGPTSASLSQFTNTAAQDTLSAALGIAGIKDLPGQNIITSDKEYKKDPWWQFNKLSGFGVYKISESQQESELRRQEQSVKSKIAEWNQLLGPYEVNQIKGGYRVYDPEAKQKIKDFVGANAQVEAYKYGIILAETTKRK